MAIIVMAIRFRCELAMLAALALWGAQAGGVPVAIAAPLIAGIVWGVWIAPRARHRLRDPARFAVESVLWLAATLALLDRLPLAIAFAVLAFATAAGARHFEPEVRKNDGISRIHA
jgi:hypothetical protein